jgi:dipeptidyl aminopeptidase/acylaminoacyl peptidase
MRYYITLLLLGCTALFMNAQSTYKQPPADVKAIMEAPPTPFVSVNSGGTAMALVSYNPNPGIATLAKPFLKLGGLRVDPQLNGRQRITEYNGITVQWLADNRKVVVGLPPSGRLSGLPQWSPDGRKMAFGIDTPNGTELWVAEARTGVAKRLGKGYLNDVLGTPMSWMDDSDRLLVRFLIEGRGPAPATSSVPTGPATEETAGKFSQVATYQDLLKNENDERQFEYYATCQPSLVSSSTGKVVPVGAPGLHMSLSWSPDENYLLVTTLRRPFSYRVPYAFFSRKNEVWDSKGQFVYTLAEFPVSDEIPRQGVVTGPRNPTWQALHPARLLWTEALDGGDPKRKAEHRDKLMRLDAPFRTAAEEVTKLRYRFADVDWTAQKDIVLVTEYDRDRRWATTWRMDMNQPAGRDTLFDRSINDDYNDPGRPVYEYNAAGDYVMAQEGDWAFFNADGASQQGEFPRLDKINLKTGAKQTLFRCAPGMYESFRAFTGKDHRQIVLQSESKTQVPNFYVQTLGNNDRKALTDFKDPAPQLTNVDKRLIRYRRPDGTPLSGTLYLPPNRKSGEKLPLFIWAYPLEYSDASTAGQVRGSENKFTFYRNDSPLFFVTQGYAVLMDATMPVIGDPETMNNTFVSQISGAGRAAIDYLDSLNLIDRSRVGVGGHSYGAFMTANLLAHTDDYAFGIARSGAYNRTLTPFGFQGERRNFWEAPEVYLKVSPFTVANKINEPILLIHGEADNNPGTHTIQTERLFQAIKGNGGTARLVLLPHESHGYRARESVQHVVSEMFEWADKYGKNKGQLKP